MSFLDSLLGGFSSGNFADLETKAKGVLGDLEKLGADVLAAHGNVLETVMAVASDVAQLKDLLVEVSGIVADLKALHTSGSVAVNPAATGVTPAQLAAAVAAQNAQTVAPAVVTPLPTTAPVAPTPAAAPADPFAAKVLSVFHLGGA